jgi:hypothetical protein
VEGSTRLEHAEELLETHGRRVGPVRVAAGRSGIALAFPRDPMVHISWPALAVISSLIVAITIRRSSS